MKIAFLCGSASPGRDGVGDYTRLLAEACAALGHEPAIVALHDGHCDSVQDDAAGPVRVLRLPRNAGWAERRERARSFLAAFQPAWVSWQFVTYGFHPKGLPNPEVLRLAGSLRQYRHHLMLHELWIGLPLGESTRARFIGWVQSRGLESLIRRIAPKVINTSNDAYRAVLAARGFPSTILPLFGNVPVASASSEELAASVLEFFPGEPSRQGLFVAATFGLLHPQWQPAATAAWLAEAAAARGLRPALLVIGRAGAGQHAVLEAFRQAGALTALTGEQDSAAISRLLQGADLGIASSPWALIGKSGSAAAMREHGLPVLVPRDEWRLRRGPVTGAPADDLLLRLADAEPAAVERWLAGRRAPCAQLPAVAAQFLDQLAL